MLTMMLELGLSFRRLSTDAQYRCRTGDQWSVQYGK